MAILSDRWIKHHAKNHNLITPFHSESKNHLEDGTPVTSYGLSSFGYDLSLGNSFRVFTTVVNNEIFFNANIEFEDGGKLDNVSITKPVTPNTDNLIIDPVNFNSDLTVLVENVKTIYIPPKGFMLGVAKERVKLARDFTGLCMEKSTLARCGLCVTVTPLEAEWEGYITLEISNKTDFPIKLTAGMGICQLLFFAGNEACEVSYSDRNGKYQNQPAEPVLPKRRD